MLHNLFVQGSQLVNDRFGEIINFQESHQSQERGEFNSFPSPITSSGDLRFLRYF